MLDPAATDLVDGLARVCVLRHEDITLLRDVLQRTEAAAGQPASPGVAKTDEHLYRSLLCEEVRCREALRQPREDALVSRLRKWEKDLADARCAAHRAVVDKWRAQGVLQPVLLLNATQAYGLTAADLLDAHTPFAADSPSSPLYNTSSPSPLVRAAQQNLSLTSPPSHTAPASGAALLQELCPLSPPGGDGDSGLSGTGMKRETRQALLTYRRQWQVLFLLWVHAVVLPDPAEAALTGALGEGWATVVSAAASRHLTRQRASVSGLVAEVLREGK